MAAQHRSNLTYLKVPGKFGEETALINSGMTRTILCCLLIFHLAVGPTFAQTPAAGQKLRIEVLDGDGTIHNVKRPDTKTMAVQVLDGDKPVPRAAVTFTAPSQGPTVQFSGGNASTTVMTDGTGKASVSGFRPNTVAGKIEIRVNTSHGGQEARATITQFNMTMADAAPPPKKSHGKTIAILAALGAAAAGGGFVATRKSGTSGPLPQPPTITLTPGAGTVGGPQ